MAARRLTRRRLLRTAFWSALGGGVAGSALAACRYSYADAAVRAAQVLVPAAAIPTPGADPLHLPREGFYLIHFAPGEGLAGARKTGRPARARGGLLFMPDRCQRPHRTPIRLEW